MCSKRLISVLLVVVMVLLSIPVSSSVVSAASSIPRFSKIEVIDGGIRFSWDPYVTSSHPEGVFYRVYYKNSKGSWVGMITTAKTSFVDWDVHPGVGFYYTIRCITQDGYDFASDYNNAGWYVRYENKPVISDISAKMYNGKIYNKIYFEGFSSRYKLYKRSMGSSEWESVSDVFSKSPVSYSFDYDGKPYAYKICGIDSNGNPSTDGAVSQYYFGSSSEPYQTRGRFLQNLATVIDKEPPSNAANTVQFSFAKKKGIVDDYSLRDTALDLNRRFVAECLMNAFDYDPRWLGTYTYNVENRTLSEDANVNYKLVNGRYYTAADSTEASLNTAVYYGWLNLDSNDKVNPEAVITADEWDEITRELSLYEQWHGKTVISFGDSSVQGRYNYVVPMNMNGVYADTLADSDRADFDNKRFPRFDTGKMGGPCEFFGEKYGMRHYDYSWSGAVMGLVLSSNYDDTYNFNGFSYKHHVANQIRTAIKENQDADLVILNGGDNDAYMYSRIPYEYVYGSRVVYDYGYSSADSHSNSSRRSDDKVTFNYTNETSFVGGTRTAFDLIRTNWSNARFVYVGSHPLDYRGVKNESLLNSRSEDDNMYWLAKQVQYVERLKALTSQYGVEYADTFYKSDLDAFDKRCAVNYCYDGYTGGSVDDRAIHPNSMGYSKFYLPRIENVLLDIE